MIMIRHNTFCALIQERLDRFGWTFFCWLRLWHGVIFGQKKIRFCGPVFPEKSGKNRIIAIFIVLVVRLCWNFQERFFLLLGGQTKIFFPDFTSENPAKSGKNRIKPENHISSYYQHVICHFSWLDHGEVNFDTYFEIFWKKFTKKNLEDFLDKFNFFP